MDKNIKLNEIYNLYTSAKYVEAFTLIEEVLAEDPQNTYALKYKEIILPHLNKKSEVGKIATVKGKNLKCPNCNAAIALSALNEVQKEKIRKHDYNNLELKCPYCHHIFTIQKKISESKIGINIGDKINYEGINYTAVGSILYEGRWYDGGYSGKLHYLEWILLGEDNSYLYFSEGYYREKGLKFDEYEFSKKVIPEFEIEFKKDFFGGNKLYINGRKKFTKEENIVKVTAIYGENSKVFKIGEIIQIYEFYYKGKIYVLEKEKAGTQLEAGIYETYSVNENEAYKIFGKDNSIVKETIFDKIKGYIFLIFLFPLYLFIENGTDGIYYLLLFIILLILYFFLKVFKFIFKSKIFQILIIGPTLGFFIIPMILSLLFYINEQIKLDEIDKSKKYKIEFTSPKLKNIQTISTEEYSNGGIKTTYKEITGLRFSVLSKEDFEIIEKIKNSPENISEDVKNVFSEENKIIKIN